MLARDRAALKAAARTRADILITNYRSEAEIPRERD